MINRSAIVTSIALILVMLAATMWRLAMLPDWAYGPNGAPPPVRNALLLFVLPACVALVGVLLAFSKRLTTATVDAVRQWQRWGSRSLVAYGVFCTLSNLHFVAASAGFAAPFSPTVVTRAFILLGSSLIIVPANHVPKLPWVPSRFTIWDLDPVRGSRSLRFGGQFLVFWGLAMVIAAFVMPLRIMLPFIVSITIALVLVIAVRTFALHREQSHERLGS